MSGVGCGDGCKPQPRHCSEWLVVSLHASLIFRGAAGKAQDSMLP